MKIKRLKLQKIKIANMNQLKRITGGTGETLHTCENEGTCLDGSSDMTDDKTNENNTIPSLVVTFCDDC